jgi:hypothetical protein
MVAFSVEVARPAYDNRNSELPNEEVMREQAVVLPGGTVRVVLDTLLRRSSAPSTTLRRSRTLSLFALHPAVRGYNTGFWWPTRVCAVFVALVSPDGPHSERASQLTTTVRDSTCINVDFPPL